MPTKARLRRLEKIMASKIDFRGYWQRAIADCQTHFPEAQTTLDAWSERFIEPRSRDEYEHATSLLFDLLWYAVANRVLLMQRIGALEPRPAWTATGSQPSDAELSGMLTAMYEYQSGEPAPDLPTTLDEGQIDNGPAARAFADRVLNMLRS